MRIRFDSLFRDGVVTDQVEGACLGDVRRAGATKNLKLLQMVPDIHEKLLFPPLIERGRCFITGAALAFFLKLQPTGKNSEGCGNSTQDAMMRQMLQFKKSRLNTISRFFTWCILEGFISQLSERHWNSGNG